MEEKSQKILDQSITSGLSYDIQGADRLINVLYKTVEELQRDVHALKTQKVIDELQLPPEILANSGLLPHKPLKLKCGRGYRPILQSEIEEAKKHSPFASQQAKWIGISQQTYRKYATMYGIYEPAPSNKGCRRMFDPERGKFPLSNILADQYRDVEAVSDWMVKDKLIRSGTFPPKCNICGYDKRRVVDNKIALLLDHRNGDNRCYTLDNLQLLCLNCTFECGRGYIRRGKHMFDADWIQGAKCNVIDPKTRW